MDTTSKAVDFVRSRGLGHWKLYRGATRVAVFEGDDPQRAVEAFQAEIESRSTGKYEVLVYEKLKGESGGDRFDFMKESAAYTTGKSNMTNEQIWEAAKAAAKQELLQEQMRQDIADIKVMLETIMKVLNVALDDDKSNDFMAQALLKPFMSAFASRVIPAAAAATTVPVAPTKSIFD